MEEQSFKTNARIILEIGKESIESKIVALSEVIKNSYDAGASKCEITIKEEGKMISLIDKEISSIEITDNGCGMNKDDLINNWLVIGTTNKKNMKEAISNLSRVPIGEKGIGRFAVNKLGNVVTIITKKANNECYKIKIDFNKFDTEKLLDEIKFNIEEVQNENPLNKEHGTSIIIEDLNESWNREELSKVYDEILKLQSPFKIGDDQFSIQFNFPDKYNFSNKLKPNEILKYSLWNCHTTIDPSKESSKFYFKFTPYSQMNGFDSESTETDFEYVYNGKRLASKIDLSKHKIGKFNINLFAFHRSSAVLKMLGDKRNAFKDYLDENGGIRIYRGGQRIYNYGTKNEDWLDLNIKRLNSPGTKLSKNILIGIIEIDPKESTDLIEKTNREGFIENDAYVEFRKVVSAVVDEFAFKIIPTKEKIKKNIDKNAKVERVDSSFEDLLSEIEDAKFENINEKDRILTLTNNLMKDYEESRKLYLSIANNSFDFHMVFHDVDKQIKGLINIINSDDKNIEEIIKSIKTINDILNLQKDLISNRDFKINATDRILEKFNAYAKYRLMDHNISLTIEDEKVKFNCIESQILRILINLFDNSVYWLSIRNSERKVFIKFFTKNAKLYLLYADNGPGFGVSDANILFKPFVTKKEGGLGLGLYIVNEIVNVHKGKIEIISNSEMIPKEYCGAKLKIEFNME